MSKEHDGLRKVAIVVACLDGQSADRVLQKMSHEDAERVREAILELRSVDTQEQRRVIDEFLNAAPASRTGRDSDSKVMFARVPSRPDARSPRMFASLGDMSPEGLASILSTERPQTIALVLSHLPPELSGKVLVRFPPHVQPEVFRRLVDLEETDPEILAEIEASLQERLSQTFALPRRRVAGLSAVEGILKASDRSTGTQLYRNLTSHDEQLAAQLQPERLEFDDLEWIDYADLQELLDSVEPDLLSLAMVGASPAVMHRVSAALPAARAAALRQELSHPAPTRLSDVETARERIGLIAQRVGIRPPRSVAARSRRNLRPDAQFFHEV
ncbi:MAG: FliG C-terminal domain-containing protein [Thermoguttaceae bacterium]